MATAQQLQDYINSAKTTQFDPSNKQETSINKGEAAQIFQQAQALGLSPAQISQMIGDPAYSEDVVKNYIQTAYPNTSTAYQQQHGFGPASGGAPATNTAAPTTVGQTVSNPQTTQAPAGQGNAGGYLNTQVAGGTTQNTDYTRYPTPIPNAPNYEAAANQQGEANLNAAKNTVALSNPNQFNPFGSQTYTIGPDGRPVQKQEFSADMGQRLFDLNSILPNVTQNIRNNTGQALNTNGFQNIMNLDNLSLPGVNDLNYNNLSGVMDLNNLELPKRQIEGGVQGQSAVAEALRQREAPRMEAARKKAEADLLVRGFNPNTEGWDERMDDVTRQENDFNLGLTALSGQEQSRLFGLDTENRNTRRAELNDLFSAQTTKRNMGKNEQDSLFNAQMGRRDMGRQELESLFGAQLQKRNYQLGEQVTQRMQPINEYGALVNSMTPQMPQFNQYQGATVEANPIFNATAQKGLFDLNRYGTSIQGELGSRGINTGSSNQNKQAGADLAGAAMTAFALMSDARLKTNISRVGTSAKGFPLYTWDWTDEGKSLVGDQPTFGTIAHEAALIDPDAVLVGADGFMRVDYRRVF